MEKRNKAKICVLTSCYPRSEDDWAGVFVQTLARELSQTMDICIVAPEDRYFDAGQENIVRFRYAPKTLQKLAYGSGILENLRKTPLSIALLPPFLLSFFRAAWRESWNAELIHSHWVVPSGFVGALLHTLTGKPHLLTVHSGGLHFLRRIPGGKPLLRFILNRSSHIVAVSKYTRDILLKSILEKERISILNKLSVIPMPVTIPEVKATHENLKRKYKVKGKRVILYIGRLIKVKGIIYLLEAMEKLTHPDAVLLVAGEGQEKAYLEQYVKERNLPVRFLDAVNGKAKAEILKIADVFVLPSIILPSGRQEGLPVSILEAISAGVPVVASDVGGVSEVIRDGITGFIVSPANPDELSTRLAQILEDDPLRRKMNTRCRQSGKMFSAESVAGRYNRIIVSLLQP